MLVTTRYFIRRGDSPGLVAVRFGCTREDLFNANPGPHVVTDRYGSRGFYSGWFVPGRRINVPIVASGAVGGPSGGSIRYPEGFSTAGFQVVAPRWDDTHPNWGGTYEAYWSQRVIIQAHRYQLPGVNTLTTLPFLRSFSGPAAFSEAMRQAGSGYPNPVYPVPPTGCLPGTTLDPVDGMCKPPGSGGPGNSTWYSNPMDQSVAYVAARKISAMVASMASTLGAMNGPSGHVGCGGGCAGGYGPSGSVGFQIPRMRGDYYRLPMPAAIPMWDDSHTSWPGSNIAFWSQKMIELLKGIPAPGLASRLVANPALSANINTWLRSNWEGPLQFLDAVASYRLPLSLAPTSWTTQHLTPYPAQMFDPMYTWSHWAVALYAGWAANYYLESKCLGAAGTHYNPTNRECALL